ncbi:Transcriptional repressor MprA [compost metagenome]
MSFCLKKLPREETIKMIAEKFGNLEPKCIEASIILYKFMGDYERAMEEHFQKYHLSDGRFMVLITLLKSEEPMKATDIANELGVSRATMTGLLDGLTRDGYIAKKDCKNDRRICFLSLTDKAKKQIDEMLPAHFKSVADFFGCLSKQETTDLKKIITKLQENLTTFASN